MSNKVPARTIIICLALFFAGHTLRAEDVSEKSISSELELLKSFSALKHTQYTNLAEQLELNIEEYNLEFFEAAMTKEWTAVSNAFVNCRKAPGHPKSRNAIWAPVHETYGAYEEWHEWKMDSELLAMFYKPILDSIPDGSIYFGGTDSGRFLITAARDVRGTPDVVIMTQNALADATYTEYLGAVFGKRAWIPDREDTGTAFRSYIEGVESGKYSSNGVVTVNGRITINGVEGVMKLNGILAKMIFENNKATYDIYVEESYVIDWMYPYIEPHGLILKLNSDPLDILPEEKVKVSREFWDTYTCKLLKHPSYADNLEARKAFAKLRLGNAGLMAYRKLYKEAEYGFLQALKLNPDSPEAHFRLAGMYKDAGDIKKAVSTIESFLEIDPEYEKAKAFLKELKKADSK